jgi:hypothetical protein
MTNDNFKVNYDSRLHFSKFLVEMREKILNSTHNYNEWMFNLRNYSSHIQGLITPEQLEPWVKEFNELVKAYNISLQNRQTNYNIQGKLFDLQDKIFKMSSQLFLPKGDDDDDNEDW